MLNRYYLLFDVGGFFIRGGALLSHKKELLPYTMLFYPAKSHLNREELLDHFVDIICKQMISIMDKYFIIDGIAFAFPGPFDYDNGICLISGVNKFDSLYGVDLRAELKNRLARQPVFKSNAAPDFTITFKNNVSMFALGERHLRSKDYQFTRMICLTIGNGTGSAFLENDKIINSRDDVPPNGWVYNLSFKDSIVDDYISSRGIFRIIKEMGLCLDLSLETIAEGARNGNSSMIKVFNRFGQLLGEMLLPWLQKFHPDVVVIGGQISNSYDLYKNQLLTYLGKESVNIIISENTSYSTFVGLSEAIFN